MPSHTGNPGFAKASVSLPRFVLNGLINANQILGEEVFKLEDWRVIGEYVYDEEGGRHQGKIWPAMSDTTYPL